MNLATAALGASSLTAPTAGASVGAFSQLAGGIGTFAQSQSVAKGHRRIGRIEAAQVRRDTRRLIGRQQVTAAANGVDPSSGSSLDIQAEAALDGEVSALRARFARDSHAAAIESEGRGALFASFGRAGKTLLGGMKPTRARSRAGETDLISDPADFSGFA